MPTEPDDRARPCRSGDDDAPTLPQAAHDESDAAWGDEPGVRDDDWYRRERPPHHD